MVTGPIGPLQEWTSGPEAWGTKGIGLLYLYKPYGPGIGHHREGKRVALLLSLPPLCPKWRQKFATSFFSDNRIRSGKSLLFFLLNQINFSLTNSRNLDDVKAAEELAVCQFLIRVCSENGMEVNSE